MDIDPEAAQLEFLIQQYEDEQRLRRQYEDESVEVVPEPVFVVKTHLESEDGGNEKVFINICSSEEVATPEETDDGRYRIPVSCGPPRPSHDKAGSPALSYDCILNPIPIKQCLEDHQYRTLIVQYCIENIETKHAVRLRKDIRFPKAKFLGGLPAKQRIRRTNPANEATEKHKIIEVEEPGNIFDSASNKTAVLSDLFGCQPLPPSRRPLIEEISSADDNEDASCPSERMLIEVASKTEQVGEVVAVTAPLPDGPVAQGPSSMQNSVPTAVPQKLKLKQKESVPRSSKTDSARTDESQILLRLQWTPGTGGIDDHEEQAFRSLEVIGIKDPKTIQLEVSDWGLHISGAVDANIPLQRSYIPMKARYISKTGKLQIMLKIGSEGISEICRFSEKLNLNGFKIPLLSNSLQFQLI